MDDRNIRRYQRSTRVQIFGTLNAADFTSGSKAATLFLELDGVVSGLDEAAVGQLRTLVGKPGRIEELSIDFKDIARTARAIKIDEPAFDDSPYRHPATSVEKPVATHADSLLSLFEDNTKPVADGGDTPAQLAAKAVLRADRDALDDCNTGKLSDNLEGVESTSAIDTLLGDAQAIITRLDAAIQNKYSRNPDKLAAWKSASHTERAPKKQKPDDTTSPPAA